MTPATSAASGTGRRSFPRHRPKDLSLKGWVKHDGRRLYFAFDVTDDVLYGIDTPLDS